MQASLKLNTKNSDYILLTVSNLLTEAQLAHQEAQTSQRLLTDETIVHSRITHPQDPSPVFHAMDEPLQQAAVPYGEMECPTCSAWKRWALEQQKCMLQLEQEITQRELLLRQTVSALTSEAQVKDRILQQYNRQLAVCRQQISHLNDLIRDKNDKMQSFTKETQHSTNKKQGGIYTTPLKLEANSQRFDGEGVIPSIHISQRLTTDEKKGRTCTTATKNNLEWSAFETNLDHIYKENPGREKAAHLDKCLFQNTMLKEYNSVLLERLKESKYRRPF